LRPPQATRAFRLTRHALPVAAQDILAAGSTRRWAIAVATNVDIHIASTSPPSAIVIDVNSGTAVNSAPIAPLSTDIYVDIGATAAFTASLPPFARAFFTRAHLRATIGVLRASALVRPGALRRSSTALASLALTHTGATIAVAAPWSGTLAAAFLTTSAGRFVTAHLHLVHQPLERDRLGHCRIGAAGAENKHRPDGAQN